MTLSVHAHFITPNFGTKKSTSVHVQFGTYTFRYTEDPIRYTAFSVQCPFWYTFIRLYLAPSVSNSILFAEICYMHRSCYTASGGVAHRDTGKFPVGPSNQRPLKIYVEKLSHLTLHYVKESLTIV